MSNTIRRGAARQGKQPQRRLGFEPLERRMLLAGDTYLINFQFDEAPDVTRYARDVGATFGDRGNGLSYGWNVNHTDQSRDRGLLPDQRFDTLIHFHAGGVWEFALANGLYEVTIAVGDPANNDGVHTINAEGVNFWNAVPDGANPLVMTKQVTVSDGRLTVNQGAAAERATRINFLHVVGLPSAPNQAPSAPTITEPDVDGKILNPADAHMEAVNFVDGDGNLHKSTDWEIRTVGPGAEVAWQTLGITGVERLHTHLGDGIFINAHAGRTSLLDNTQYELRARFRDDAGSVSSYAVRSFVTGQSSTTFPLQLMDVGASPAPTWTNILGVDIELPGTTGILSPGIPIIGIDPDSVGSSPNGETPDKAIDQTLAKYLNFGEENSGFIVTPVNPTSIVKSFRITTANDAPDRDPTTWQLFGTNDAIVSGNNSAGTAENWTPIASGSVALPTARDTLGPIVNVTNTTPYSSYKMLFPVVRNAGTANSMQIAEIQFYGDGPAATPPTLRIEDGATGDLLLSIAGTDAVGNAVVNPAMLAAHVNARVVVQAGTNGLNVPPSNLTISNGHGGTHTLFLPAIALAPNQRMDLWVASDGATYFGAAAQTAPDFSNLARASESSVNVPFAALQPGYVIDEVAGGFQLPVNIAFVPNPGPTPAIRIFM